MQKQVHLLSSLIFLFSLTACQSGLESTPNTSAETLYLEASAKYQQVNAEAAELDQAQRQGIDRAELRNRFRTLHSDALSAEAKAAEALAVADTENDENIEGDDLKQRCRELAQQSGELRSAVAERFAQISSTELDDFESDDSEVVVDDGDFLDNNVIDDVMNGVGGDGNSGQGSDEDCAPIVRVIRSSQSFNSTGTQISIINF